MVRPFDPRRPHLAPAWSDGCAHASDPVAARRAEIAEAVRNITGGNEIADELIYREWLLSEVPRAKTAAAGA